MPCSSSRDSHGTTFLVAAAEAPKTPGGRTLAGYPAIDVWWSRSDRSPGEETLIIRQEYPDRSTADVIEITQGQAYDLIDALNKAMERT